MKRVAVLGATGSIGRQALEVIDRNAGLELVAASSGTQAIDGLAPLTQVGGDPTELLERAQPDVVLNAIVGFAGVTATLWALEHGIDLALANKESLVAAGELALAARERGGGRLLPVDSEHSAVFQCLEGRDPQTVHSIVLTGSGGPFRGRNRAELQDVTPDDALDHPTWRMGPKITVDSATLANKGLEVIEAHFLFGLPYDRVEVVIQPTSVVHALVRFRDGASLAHLGYPDMRVPISCALTYPERAATDVDLLDFSAGLTLDFEPVDAEAFPLLGLARRAGERGGTNPCVFNAANEVAVGAFLEGRLPFLGIAEVVEETLEASDGAPARDLDELVAADGEARRIAERGLAVGTSASRGGAGKGGKLAGRRTVQRGTDKPRERGILPPAPSGGTGAGLRPAGGAAGRGGEA
jgi:1-deoxy-D-xylulose-5-phosphate reductoisomerase